MMLLALIAAAALSGPVDDYFPMIAGTKWTYEDSNGLQMVDEIGAPVDIGKNQTATPKTSSISGQNSGSELYRSDGEYLLLVGYLDKHARTPINILPQPQPILRVASKGKTDWQYIGELPTSLGPVLLTVHANADHGPVRKVLDRMVETLVVHVVSKIGNDKQGVEVRQDVVYGKGIGMIELTEATKAQGQTVKKVLKLVKFEPPQG